MMKYLNGQLVEMSPEEVAAFEAERVPKQADYIRSITNHIEATAKSRGYDNGQSLASYAASTNPTWADEAKTFIAWRDAVWVYVYQQLAAVQAQERERPTPKELIAELPSIQW